MCSRPSAVWNVKSPFPAALLVPGLFNAAGVAAVAAVAVVVLLLAAVPLSALRRARRVPRHAARA